MEKYSRKVAKSKIKALCESQGRSIEVLSNKILEWKSEYLKGNIGKPYKTKTDVVNMVTEDIADELSISILFTTILLGKSTFQSYIGHVASQINLEIESFRKAQLAAWVLAYCDGGAYDIIAPAIGSMMNYSVEPKISLSVEDSQELSRCFFLPPSKDKLNDWTNPYNGGYSFERSYAILGDSFNKHDYPIDLKTLNILQSVKYKLTNNVDTPQKLDEEASDDRAVQFALAEIQTRKVLKDYRDDEFSFVWKFDKRGRVYSCGYDINVQGDSYRKASLEFAKEEIVNESGKRWLKIDIANHYGLDKELWEDRVKFVDKNDSILEALADKADEPLLYIQAVQAYRKAQKGLPTGYIVRLDATASGPQIMNILFRDLVGMRYLNVRGDDTRHDLYTLVAQTMYENTKDSQIWRDLNDDFAKVRKVVKKPIMTSFYNSKSKPKEIFGEDTIELQEFYKALKKYCKGALEVQDTINACWDNSKDVNIWTLPDGHTAYCPVSKVLESKIEIPEKGMKITYTHTVQRANFAESRSLCPDCIGTIV
ncbi:DNA-directed RNA polymerase [Campylobacter vicugnae]|uniref:DNA-directed RNA polymerase n=1 Tax=Campylobacter vicugnae TaxID=1660076 RepID=A0ABZ2E6F5_9BACT|nr:MULTISPECIES: DNA-directed RNA polymerase [unclassified Campylobacter]